MPKDPDAGLSLIRIYDQLKNYIGKELYFVIENGNETGFSFINVDDFRTSMTEKYAYAQIIYMPGSSYPIQDKDVTLYAV